MERFLEWGGGAFDTIHACWLTGFNQISLAFVYRYFCREALTK